MCKGLKIVTCFLIIFAIVVLNVTIDFSALYIYIRGSENGHFIQWGAEKIYAAGLSYNGNLSSTSPNFSNSWEPAYGSYNISFTLELQPDTDPNKYNVYLYLSGNASGDGGQEHGNGESFGMNIYGKVSSSIDGILPRSYYPSSTNKWSKITGVATHMWSNATFNGTGQFMGQISKNSSSVSVQIIQYISRYEGVCSCGYAAGYNNSSNTIIINNVPFLDISPSPNDIFCELDTSFIPQISVSDTDNDTLTCNYYIDSETAPRDTKTVMDTTTAQTVSFSPLNMSALTDGNHTMKFQVSDGKSDPVVSTVNFRVDKMPPVIGTVTLSSSISSVSVSGSATDNFTEPELIRYKYKIGSSETDWISGTSYTETGLFPNTLYNTVFSAIDLKGHIAEKQQSIHTKAQVPALAVNSSTSYTIKLTATDQNSSMTKYCISVNDGEKYVTPEGNLTEAPIWTTLCNKEITVTGLEPNTTYSFKAKARNEEGIETAECSPVSGTTLMPPPAAPANLIATATSNQITVSWDAVQGATNGYDIMADSNIVYVGTSTTYTHTSLSPGTPHTYQVRAKNAGGPGSWSTQITKSTLPLSPDIPINLSTVAQSTSITVTWNNVPGATGYAIEVDGELVNNGPNTNYIHSSLIPGTHHTYRVRSINPGGKSDWSAPVNATTKQETSEVPANLAAIPSQNTISLIWDAVNGATGYDIEVDGVTIDNSIHTAYTHKNLAPGSQHIYRVRAKKNGVLSDWSAALVVETLVDVFGVPTGIKANADDTSVTLSWNPVSGATGYDIEAESGIIDNGTECSVLITGLEPGSTYTFRVRARGETESSDWSEAIQVATFDLPAPVIVNAASDEMSIVVSWVTSTGSSLVFDLEVDGTVIAGITENSYICGGFTPGTQHIFRVRARNDEGESNWSIPVTQSTMFSVTDAPTGLLAIVRDTSAVIMWESMEGAVSYDIDVDGITVENITDTKYMHTGLQSGSSHTYRVRANNNTGESGWSDLLSVSTKPDRPAAPTNVIASSTTSKILVTWDEITGADEYEIEVDGVIVEIGMALKYLHSGVTPDSHHSYRVRSKNSAGYSGWSDLITVNTKSSTMTYVVDCVIGEEFDLAFSATDIQDIRQYTFTISYDAEELEVTDLCGLTSRVDNVAGGITGTDIQIVQYSPGTIVFRKSTSAQSYQAWSGIVNSISFKSLIDGQANVTYSFQ